MEKENKMSEISSSGDSSGKKTERTTKRIENGIFNNEIGSICIELQSLARFLARTKSESDERIIQPAFLSNQDIIGINSLADDTLENLRKVRKSDQNLDAKYLVDFIVKMAQGLKFLENLFSRLRADRDRHGQSNKIAENNQAMIDELRKSVNGIIASMDFMNQILLQHRDTKSCGKIIEARNSLEKMIEGKYKV